MSAAPGPVGHLSFTEILDTSLRVSWEEPLEKNGIVSGHSAPGVWLATNTAITPPAFR